MAKVRVWYRHERKRWYASYRVPGVCLEKKEYQSFKTKSEAQRFKEYMEYQLNHKPWHGAKGLTWSTATELYLAERDPYIKEQTRKDIKNTFKVFGDLIGELQTDLIKQNHITEFIAKRKKSGRYNPPTNQTINKDLRNLRTFFNWCSENSYIEEELKFKMLPVNDKAFIPPSQDQIAEMFNKAKELYFPLYARMVIAFTTGLRRGAVEKLYLNSAYDNYVDIEQKSLITTEKRGYRIVKVLGDNTMSVIEQQICSLPDGADKLFVDKWDGKCRNTFESIRIKGMDFHALRNIAVSILGDKGESAAVLQKKLGHKSFNTTSRYYMGVNQETDKRTTKMLDDFLASTHQ